VRNIFLFIRRNFNFLFFLALQIIALSFLFRYKKFHEAAFMNVAGEITGRLSSVYSEVEYYFNLKKENEKLAAQNEALLSMMKESFSGPDTTVNVHTDTLSHENPPRKYLYRQARVVNNSVNFPNNYLTINRGSSQGIRPDMGVIGPDGIVGTVVNTSENFAVVMSLLHRQASVSVKLKNTNEIGRVIWDGKDPGYVIMENVKRTADVKVGDSVITSGFSLKYPENILVGTVAEIIDDGGAGGFLKLRLKTATNFYNVNHVFVVENFQREEQRKLEESSKIFDE
jgi:rod shape-determining protein MreC